MPRPLRTSFPGAWHHVMNRTLEGVTLFSGPAHRGIFLDLLADIGETFGVETHAYGMADDHYHLLVRTPHANLSGAMRHLNSVYTQRHNQLEGGDGALFRGRFKTILIDEENYLPQVSRYVHLEAAGLARPGDAKRYKWSSFQAYVGLAPAPAWLHRKSVLASFRARSPAKQYQAFVETGVDAELVRFYAKQHMDPVLGSPAFRKRVARLTEKRRSNPPVQLGGTAKRGPAIRQIIVATAAQFRVAVPSLFQDGRGRGNLPRMVAAALCRRVGGHSLQDIADAFGMSSFTSVSAAVRRFDENARVDPALLRKAAAIKKRLGAD
ncbi:MAG: transposase [Burkholderiales bacterium]